MLPEKKYDEWLIYRIKTGDRKAFKLLTKRWYAKLIRHIYLMTKDEEISKDIAQETWSVVYKRINTLRRPELFKVWIFKIARNKSADWIKQEEKRRNFKTEFQNNNIDNNSEQEESNSETEKVRLAMKKLSITDQQILNLFYIENCNIRHISTILNIPVGTVKSRLFNAREHLKKTITK